VTMRGGSNEGGWDTGSRLKGELVWAGRTEGRSATLSQTTRY
jgi:hypothetical protein